MDCKLDMYQYFTSEINIGGDMQICEHTQHSSAAYIISIIVET